jgi:RNAse (barnase) inhibitor barstar
MRLMYWCNATWNLLRTATSPRLFVSRIMRVLILFITINQVTFALNAICDDHRWFKQRGHTYVKLEAKFHLPDIGEKKLDTIWENLWITLNPPVRSYIRQLLSDSDSGDYLRNLVWIGAESLRLGGWILSVPFSPLNVWITWLDSGFPKIYNSIEIIWWMIPFQDSSSPSSVEIRLLMIECLNSEFYFACLVYTG